MLPRPLTPAPPSSFSTRTRACDRTHAGGKFNGEGSGYRISGGLHGVGVTVVNALSEALHVTVWRDGREYSQGFAAGTPLAPMAEAPLPAGQKGRHGTRIKFLFDPKIFKPKGYKADVIRDRLRELAFLNSGVKICFRQTTLAPGANGDHDGHPLHGNGNGKAGSSKKAAAAAAGEPGVWQEFYSTNGLADFMTFLLDRDRRQPLHDEPLYFRSTYDKIQIELALQWTGSEGSAGDDAEALTGYANCIRNKDGGTHIEGVRGAVARAVNAAARRARLLKDEDKEYKSAHVREGMLGIVSVKVPEPEFEGQTKTRLGNPEVKKAVETAVAEWLQEALDKRRGVLGAVVSRAQAAADLEEAMRRAREEHK